MEETNDLDSDNVRDEKKVKISEETKDLEYNYNKLKKRIKRFLNKLCYRLDYNFEETNILVISSMNIMKEYIIKNKNNFFRDEDELLNYLTIVALSCFWITNKFHEDDFLSLNDIYFYTGGFNCKLLENEEIKILNCINFRLYPFMFSKD